MLEVQIFKQFDGFTLDVDFATDRSLTALLGPSGSDKTLTLRAVAGVLSPDGGRIVLDGEPLFDSKRGIDLTPQARRVGYVPQQYALFPHLDVAGNVGFGLQGVDAVERRQRVAEMIDLVGLSGLAQRRPRQL